MPRMPLFRFLGFCLGLGLYSSFSDAAATISGIKVQLPAEQLQAFGMAAQDNEALTTQITQNLASQQFRVVGSTPATAYSHTLEIQIAAPKNASTPVGFSFSSGNSDPRALGFQKADVVDISCRLQATTDSRILHETAMSFAAQALLTATSKSSVRTQLADDISTVCFDLLQAVPEAHLPSSTPTATSTSTSTWLPNVHIETIPAAVPDSAVSQTAEEAEKPGPEHPAQTSGRKQIIIHHQGTPLLLKFGHERL